LFRKFPERFFRKISGTIFQNIPEISGTFRNSVTIRNSGTTFRKFPVYGKKIVPEIVPEFRISGTFSIMEMEKISGSFPYVNRNPEFRWKPYSNLILEIQKKLSKYYGKELFILFFILRSRGWNFENFEVFDYLLLNLKWKYK